MTNDTFATIFSDELSSVTGGFMAGKLAEWFPGFVPGAQHPRERDPERMRRFQAGQQAVRRSLGIGPSVQQQPPTE
jgi:hypothetical protein